MRVSVRKTTTHQATAKQSLIAFVVFFIIGLGLIAGGVFYRVNSKSKLDNYVHVNATVVSYSEHYDRDSGNKMYSPIVEYEVDGVKYREQSNSSSNIKPVIGSKVEIAYDPNNPEYCIFVQDNIIVFIILLGLGIVFTLVGGGSLIHRIIQMRRGDHLTGGDGNSGNGSDDGERRSDTVYRSKTYYDE